MRNYTCIAKISVFNTGIHSDVSTKLSDMLRKCGTSLSKCISFSSDINSILTRKTLRRFDKMKIRQEGQRVCSNILPNRKQTRINTEKKVKNLANKQVTADKVSLRQSREEDINFLVQLSQREGWMCSNSCFRMILKHDPCSFIVAVHESGIPVGYVGVCHILDNLCYLIHFLVRKDLRGEGVGRQLYSAMLDRLLDKNGYMDVHRRDIELQEKKGFIHKSFKFNAFIGTVTSRCRGANSKKTQSNILPLISNELWHLVIGYDRSVYKDVDREKMLRMFLFGDNIYAVAAVCNGAVKGYGSLMILSENESSINTIFGDDDDVVDDIIKSLLENIPDGSTLTFNLLADKRLPERFADFEVYSSQQRLYNKYSLESNADTGRMFYILSL